MTQNPELTHSPFDEQFLQQVDESLAEMLGSVCEQEQHLAEGEVPAAEAPGIWNEIMGRLNHRLDHWQVKLEAVAGEVREVEAELRQHQEALRGWTATLESVRNAAVEGNGLSAVKGS